MVLGPSLLRSSLRATAFARPSSTLMAGRISGIRRLTQTFNPQVKVLAVLYDGREHAKQVPGLLGTTENELGLRQWLESQGHTLVT
ncbi:Similar to Formate dehydrogenase; acc. no. Q07103, partial [Pyronema omphalodes CBS 100304]